MSDWLHELGARLPGFALRAARAARGAAYRAASPVDAWRRRRAGKAELPPLWLRRHAGRVADFERPNAVWVEWLRSRGVLARGGLALLDVGCGPGSLALALRPLLPDGSRYVGFDVHEPSIRWCARAFAEDRRFAFHLARLSSPYGGCGGSPVLSYRFPMEDAGAAAVVARSVFTHLVDAESEHYLNEVRRVLAPDGLAFVSAFLFEGEGRPGEVPAFPYPAERTAATRWRVAARPHAGVAYARERFAAMLAASGLALVDLQARFLPGRDRELKGQDLLVLARADA